MKRASFLWCVCTALALVLTVQSAAPAASKAAPAPEGPKPWALRDHFSFGTDRGYLDYDAEWAEWRVRAKDESLLGKPHEPGAPPEGTAVVVDTAGFSLLFEDGTSLSSRELGKGSESHDTLGETPFGPASFYDVVFPEKNGLAITHRLTNFQERPFLLMTLTIENRGAEPVRLKEVRPAVAPANGIRDWGADAQVAFRQMQVHCGRALYEELHAPSLAIFHDPRRGATFAWGVLSSGLIDGAIDITTHEGSWQGAAVYRFEPGRTIAPGERLCLDPLWISYGLGNPSQVNRYFGWCCAILHNPGEPPTSPRAWVTVSEDEGLDDLVQAAQRAAGIGVKYALLPAYWEGRPGSLQGAAPRYPKNISAAAKALSAVGVRPGITVDPLLADSPKDGAAAAADDGRVWIDPGTAEGRELATKRVAQLCSEGFSFVVVQPSDIPDAVLLHFGLSRAEANQFALEAAVYAAGPETLVLPKAASTLKPEAAAWVAAAASLGRAAEYGLIAGPVRFDLATFPSEDELLLTAMRMYPGPVELFNRAQGRDEDKLMRLFSSDWLRANPLDAATPAPRLWQLRANGPAKELDAACVLAFPQAPAWTLTDLEDQEPGDFRVWQSGPAASFSDPAATIPSAGQFTIHGIHRAALHPIPVGIRGEAGLGWDKLQSWDWDEKRSVLSAQYSEGFGKGAAAYIYMPSRWESRSPASEQTVLASDDQGILLALSVEPGLTAFQAKFRER